MISEITQILVWLCFLLVPCSDVMHVYTFHFPRYHGLKTFSLLFLVFFSFICTSDGCFTRTGFIQILRLCNLLIITFLQANMASFSVFTFSNARSFYRIMYLNYIKVFTLNCFLPKWFAFTVSNFFSQLKALFNSSVML